MIALRHRHHAEHMPAPVPGRYRLDPAKCIAEFSIRHLLVATVRGRLRAVQGELEIAAAGPQESWVRIDFDAGSAATHNRDRDEAIRGPGLLDAEHHPLIRFDSFDVLDLGDGEMWVFGDLFVRGQSTEVCLDTTVVAVGDDRIRLAATASVSRRDLGLRWESLEPMGALIADTVSIIAAAEFVR